MTIIYVLLIVVLLLLILLFFKLLVFIKKADSTLSELHDALVTLNGDLPIILENIKEVSEEIKETSKMAKYVLKKAKEPFMWLNIGKEFMQMILKLKKIKKESKEGGKHE